MQTTNCIFITGTGTDVGKTVISAIIAEALNADYWKPVQAGFENGTDSEWVRSMFSSNQSKTHRETYKLKLAASPHIAAREEGMNIELDIISKDLQKIKNQKSGIKTAKKENDTPSSHVSPLAVHDYLIIEGAGGLLVPLNENEFVIDLIKKIKAKVILVSRNYLGSINHSLLTAMFCRQHEIDVIGWVFNDRYMRYEDEIVKWSGIPKIGSVPLAEKTDKTFIAQQAQIIRPKLLEMI